MYIVVQLLQIYSWIIIASALVSWLPIPRDHPIIRILSAVTEPVYAPIRAVISPQLLGGIDISPIIVLFAIRALSGALMRM